MSCADGRQASDLFQLPEVDTRPQQASRIHQDAKAHHRQRSAGVADQLEELLSHSFAQAEGAEREEARPW